MSSFCSAWSVSNAAAFSAWMFSVKALTWSGVTEHLKTFPAVANFTTVAQTRAVVGEEMQLQTVFS